MNRLLTLLLASSYGVTALHYLHLTDFHIDPYYEHNTHVYGACHSDESIKGSMDRAGHFGTRGSQCDSPLTLINGTFDALTRLNMSIPLILWTGDSSRHDRDRGKPKTMTEVFAQNDFAVSKFQNTFNLSETIIVPSIGNWDVFPADYLSNKGEAPTTLDRLYESWKPLINDSEIEKSFRQGGYYKRSINHDLHVLSLNTMWWFAANNAVGDCLGEGPGDEQLNWIEEMLKTLPGRILLIGHVPPVFDQGILYNPQCYIKFVRLLAQDGQGDKKIIGSIFGHTNKDTLAFVMRHPIVKPEFVPRSQLIVDKKKGPSHSIDLMYLSSQHLPGYDLAQSQILSVLYTGPSIVPVNNPSFRLGKLERGEAGWYHESWTQYFVDLLEANRVHDMVDRTRPLFFTQEYSTKDYNMTILDRQSWHDFLMRFLVDSDLADRYERYIGVEGDAVEKTPGHAPLKIPKWAVILTILSSVFAFVLGLIKIGADVVMVSGEENVNERLIRGVEAMYADDGDD